jgi:arginyl-tRNA synthetase
MSIVQKIKEVSAEAIEKLYGVPAVADDMLVNQTKPEFEGDYTVVLFALVKQLRKSPEQLGKDIGEQVVSNNPSLFTGYNVIKGFLNLSVDDSFFSSFLSLGYNREDIGRAPSRNRKVIVEYSSPNTNKPLHLGHLRNNFLGWSIAEILKANGNEVMKSCIVNDRGIHICKSMIAWKLFAQGATPDSTGIKGDHFVGDYYVRCENQIREEAAQLASRVEKNEFDDIAEKDRQRLVELTELMKAIIPDSDKNTEKLDKLKDEIKEIIRSNTSIMRQAQQMLVAWENNDPEVIALWKTMNEWVYAGFKETYERIGTDFDKTYYESGTYLLGKKFVEEGLKNNVLYRKDDGSVWIDLSNEGLDEKLVLRKDGTSVYITQDLGLADEKYKDFPYDQSIYVIADEQNYHMKVLHLILKKLGKPYADGIFHLSYGMVELPEGKMKSREGTVVDADDLVDEMVNVAEKKTEELGKVKDFNKEELKELYDILALGALKFFLLRVDPKKRIVFNPKESIELHGFTGPFIQYTHARIRSILRKESFDKSQANINNPGLLKLEKALLVMLEQYPSVVQQAAVEYNPSVIATYVFNIAQAYNSFYTEHSVLNAESAEKKQLRLQLCQLTANVIRNGMALLGIRVPERM